MGLFSRFLNQRGLEKMKTKKPSSDSVVMAAMITPALVLLLLFLVIPFFISIGLSFTNQRLLPGPIPTKFVGLRNFETILKDSEFWRSFFNVLLFTAMVIPLQCGFALLSAILLNGQKKGQRFFQGAFFLPYITPMVVVCVIWSTMFQFPSGVLNSLLKIISFGMAQPVEWLGNPHTALLSITLLSAWQAYGFQMVIYMAGLQNIPAELYEAAAMDGVHGWKRFTSITWPSLYQTNVFVLIITTIQALQLFTQVNILTQGGPQNSTNTLVHYIYRTGFVIQNIGKASAASLILFVLVVVIYLGLSKLTQNDPTEAVA